MWFVHRYFVLCTLCFVLCALSFVPWSPEFSEEKQRTKFKVQSTKDCAIHQKNHFAASTARSKGISSKLVILLKARNLSLISAYVNRRTRSVPNFSTLKEAITDPKIIARLIVSSSNFSWLER